ncbi:MAG: aminotransferase class V-fold PLP-dependent enzyme [Spirochaetes bacterium]|jgi:selenocysteine lyase/cysteine desulfurase|nr:aminotransferase class V-fold PLP-dependent enzyme [Spirochaetota bacterium]
MDKWYNLNLSVANQQPDLSDGIQVSEDFERTVLMALKTYSNVHRGSGHFSLMSTEFFEKSREIVKAYSGLTGKEYVTIFCSPYGFNVLTEQLGTKNYFYISSSDIGLSLGVVAIVINRNYLPGGTPFQTGGGVVKLVSPKSVVWSNIPERYEAGTPAVINAIAFAKALQLKINNRKIILCDEKSKNFTVNEILNADGLDAYSGIELLIKLREKLIGKGLEVPTVNGFKPYINFDNAASTPTFEPIWNTFKKTLLSETKIQKQVVEETKSICSKFLDAPREIYDIVFANNTTEAINLAAKTICLTDNSDIEPVVLNSPVEHHSNELPWRFNKNFSLIRLPANENGLLNLETLEKYLNDYNVKKLYGKKRIKLFSVCGSSNVLGTFNDLHAIGKITHKYGVIFFVDAAQLVAHRKTDMLECRIDILAFSGHKMYAPFGAGALVFRKGCIEHNNLIPIHNYENANAAGIAALGKSMVLLQKIGFDVIEKEEYKLTSQVIRELLAIPEIEIFGQKSTDSSGISNRGAIVSFKIRKTPHNLAVKELAEIGAIGARDGCFCSHMIVKHLLKIHPLREKLAELLLILLPKLSHPSSLLPGLVRISFGIENSEDEIRHFVTIIRQIVNRHGSKIERFIASKNNGTPFIKHTETQNEIEKFIKQYVVENLKS